MSGKSISHVPNNFGPVAILRVLEEKELGDGPLATALRHELQNRRMNSNGIVIGATLRGSAGDQF